MNKQLEDGTYIHLNIFSDRAFDLIKDAAGESSVLDSGRVIRLPDNEVVYDCGRLSDFVETIKTKIIRRLRFDAYHIYNNDKRLGEKYACILCIALGDDEGSKKEFPAIYDELKGHRLDPLAAEAIKLLQKRKENLSDETFKRINEYSARMLQRLSEGLERLDLEIKAVKERTTSCN